MRVGDSLVFTGWRRSISRTNTSGETTPAGGAPVSGKGWKDCSPSRTNGPSSRDQLLIFTSVEPMVMNICSEYLDRVLKRACAAPIAQMGSWEVSTTSRSGTSEKRLGSSVKAETREARAGLLDHEPCRCFSAWTTRTVTASGVCRPRSSEAEALPFGVASEASSLTCTDSADDERRLEQRLGRRPGEERLLKWSEKPPLLLCSGGGCADWGNAGRGVPESSGTAGGGLCLLRRERRRSGW
mmetsp:Transcript_31652/g.96876  ORF Transcript_31652/g.96876 Transcript_31652/m.96876 type:complete len:241 (-) Transcript_31652:146-868(-)